RRIAPLRFLPQRLENYRVEIAGQPPGEARGRGATRLGDSRHPRHFRGISTPRGEPPYHLRRRLRLFLADGAEELGRGATFRAEGTLSSEKLEEEEPERVHIARRRHRLAPHLLGRRVFRR